MQTISKKGIVVENNNGRVKVMIQKDSGCGSCSTCGGCEIKPAFYTTFTSQDLKIGDSVYLDSKTKVINKLSFLTYIVPVFMMVIGAILPNIFLKNLGVDINILTLISVVLFLIISIFFLRLYDKKYENKKLIEIRKA